MTENSGEIAKLESDKIIYSKFINWLSKHKEPSTVSAYQTGLNQVKEFCKVKGYEFEDLINESSCLNLCQWLESQDIQSRTAENYANRFGRLVKYYHDRGYIRQNPMALALEEYQFGEDDKSIKIWIPLKLLRKGIERAENPLNLVVVVILLKTGLRRSELYNLDLDHVHLDHPDAKEWMPSPRKEIIDRPDSIYIDSSISEGDVINKRKRKYGNKPNSSRIIPIDEELKNTLIWWLGMRPVPKGDYIPLLTNCEFYYGTPVSHEGIRDRCVDWAEKYGMKGENVKYDFHPHWCRHFFTTKLRENITNDEVEVGTPKGYIQSLRGDVSNETIDIYTHNWGPNEWITQVYKENIPSLL